jgi:hypothetical protein
MGNVQAHKQDKKRGWSPTKEAFDILLALLDPHDRDRAGERYERLRTKLIRYFAARQPQMAEELADEVYNRVARRLVEGAQIPRDKVQSYFLGVARLVFLEGIKGPDSKTTTIEEEENFIHNKLEVNPFTDPNPLKAWEQDFYNDCSEQCLGKLSTRAREMLLRFYEGNEKIEGDQKKNREQLAKEYGLTTSKLRMRVLRLRRRHKTCILGCLKTIHEAKSPKRH